MKKLKKIKIILSLLAVLALLGFIASSLYPRPDLPETSEAPEKVVVSADEYEQKFHDLAKERYEELKKQKSCLAVAHADTLTFDEILSDTRYTDSFLNKPAMTGVGFGISAATAMLDVQPAGDNIELRFKSFYETTGKVKLLYQAYLNGSYQTLFSETVTCYAFFVPQGSQQWFTGTLTPPDMPQWSLEGIMPNDLCFERQLDTGDTQYFIARLYDPNTQDCTATNYAGSSQFGVEFNFWYSNARVIDSDGLHTFSIPQNHPITFVSSSVNSIDALQQQQYNPEDLVYSSNLTVATKQLFYCSYVITNDRPENTTVINENSYNTYNNYDFRKFPVYRITNNKFQSYDEWNNYETKYYDEYYIDNGITINNDNKLVIDYDTLQVKISNPLELQFKSLFDDIYSFQPDIGLEFNLNNNTIDYPAIINPSGGGGGWQEPFYPEINTEPVITATVPYYQVYVSETVPSNIISSSEKVVSMGWGFLGSLGLTALIVPLVIAALLWKVSGGD